MTTGNIEDMVQRAVHLGHPTSRWNPKMAPYIYTKRNGVYIIDLIQTASQLKRVCNKLTELSSEGKTFLFVGTKRQASQTLARVALECDSFYVNQRWLGGMLTNWKTIQKSLYQLQELENQLDQDQFRSSEKLFHSEKKSSALQFSASTNQEVFTHSFGEEKTQEAAKQNTEKKLTKKEGIKLRKRKERLQKYLGGLKGMTDLPDVVVIVGQIEEMNAVLECQKLGLTTVSVLDTDCDPTLSNFFVVANDDSIKSLEFICHSFLQAILSGKEYSTKNRQK